MKPSRYHAVLQMPGAAHPVELDIASTWLPRLGEILNIEGQRFRVLHVDHRVMGPVNTEVPPQALATVHAVQVP